MSRESLEILAYELSAQPRLSSHLPHLVNRSTLELRRMGWSHTSAGKGLPGESTCLRVEISEVRVSRGIGNLCMTRKNGLVGCPGSRARQGIVASALTREEGINQGPKDLPSYGKVIRKQAQIHLMCHPKSGSAHGVRQHFAAAHSTKNHRQLYEFEVENRTYNK